MKIVSLQDYDDARHSIVVNILEAILQKLLAEVF